MAINFPANPITGDSHSHNGVTWVYDGVSWGAMLPYYSGFFTPIVKGLTTDGSASYSHQRGWWSINGKEVKFTVYILWSGHTGTGQLSVDLNDIPYTPSAEYSNMFEPVIPYRNNLTVPSSSSAQGYLTPGSKIIRFTTVTTGAVSNLAMDAAAELLFSGSFVTD